MKGRDLLLTLALILFAAPYLTAQTQPIQTGFSGGTVGTAILFPDGTCAAPAMTFSADTDTGFFRPSANQVELCSSTNNPMMLWAQGSTVSHQSQVLAWGSSGISSADVGLTRVGAASLTVNNAATLKASFHTTGTAITLAVPAGGLGLATASTASAGNTGQGARLVVVCGPTAGTASLLFYAGTTNTPVVLANAVGGGLIGC